jgi:hypothetical protein
MTSQKYWFVCDQDECDSAIEFHARDGFGFPNGTVKMTCPCGKDMQYISTQPTEGESMTTTEQAPFGATITDMSEADKLRVDLEGQQTIINGLRTTVNKHRDSVRDLYTHLNDMIDSDELEESSSITMKELSDILTDFFGEGLLFLKTFDIEIEWTVRASVQVKAKYADDARSIAEDISFDEPELDIDENNTEIDRIDIDAEGVRTCREQ